jgi:hypothetical protein
VCGRTGSTFNAKEKEEAKKKMFSTIDRSILGHGRVMIFLACVSLTLIVIGQ